MSAENFFSRWSRRKRDAAQDVEPEAVAPAAAESAPQPEAPPPTMDDVAKLDRDADYARFMRRDVDEAVKRSAMKKLFSDPHFNVMDGLDIYIDDYNKFEPLPAAMLALLDHAKPVLNPPGLRDDKKDESTAPRQPEADVAAEAAATEVDDELPAAPASTEQPGAAMNEAADAAPPTSAGSDDGNPI